VIDMAFQFISTARYAQMQVLALAEPPSWTRLEPQITLGDPRPGIEARVHDPLWLMGRQWQFGEFQGEDAGTPLTVRVTSQTRLVDRWAPVGDSEADLIGRPLAPDALDLLEPFIEREPSAGGPVGLRARAESGSALLAALDDEELGDLRDTLAEAFPLGTGPMPDGDLDPAWVRLTRLLKPETMVDGEDLCMAFEAAGGLPEAIAPADPAAAAKLLDVITGWAAWHRAEVAPAPGGDDLWVGERFEYRFRAGAGPVVLQAPDHRGGAIDWWTFDAADPSVHLAQPDGAADPEPQALTHAVLATPLRYSGMPSDRLWEVEDARVNLGVVESEPWDLARLVVAEFALTYGNDWLVVPLDVPYGAVIEIDQATYLTTFGEHYLVRPTNVVSPDGRWRMFAVTSADGRAVMDGLLIPPGAVDVQDGPPLEEVMFLRDEMADLAWAVERIVEGPSGLGRPRSRELDDPRPPVPGPVPSAKLDYLLQTTVPASWIPYLPLSSGYEAVELMQGRMTDAAGTPVLPRGVLLNRADLQVLKNAEVPREGVLARRLPSLTRRSDGAYIRWTTRRVVTGRGEGASGLAFDSAFTRGPRAG
jgi:hypothetical protein